MLVQTRPLALCRVPKARICITCLCFSFFSSRMFEPTFSPFRHFVYLDLSRNLVPSSSHSLRLSRHFEYISILVGNFGHVILLCARVFSRAAAILKSEKTLGTRLVFLHYFYRFQCFVYTRTDNYLFHHVPLIMDRV